MTNKQAIRILRAHNKWRRGADSKMIEPASLGEAIDHALIILVQFDKFRLDACHYNAGIKTVKNICNNKQAKKNPSVALAAISQFCDNLLYQRPLTQKE